MHWLFKPDRQYSQVNDVNKNGKDDSPTIEGNPENEIFLKRFNLSAERLVSWSYPDAAWVVESDEDESPDTSPAKPGGESIFGQHLLACDFHLMEDLNKRLIISMSLFSYPDIINLWYA